MPVPQSQSCRSRRPRANCSPFPRREKRRSFYPLARARSRLLPDVQNGARLYDPTVGNGMPSAHDAGAVLYNGQRVVDDRVGLQAHCKNQPSDHGQLVGISKLNPRRLGTRFYKSEVRSELASGGACRIRRQAPLPSRARGDKNSIRTLPAQVKRDGRATAHTFRDTFASWLVQRG